MDDDLLKNIEENEEEIGPVDDDDDEPTNLKDEAGNDDLRMLGFIDNEEIQGDGVYYDGDEPEDDDSQDQIDDQENFSDAGEEGEGSEAVESMFFYN